MNLGEERILFAAVALQGILAGANPEHDAAISPEVAAKASWAYADAMMIEQINRLDSRRKLVAKT